MRRRALRRAGAQAERDRRFLPSASLSSEPQARLAWSALTGTHHRPDRCAYILRARLTRISPPSETDAIAVALRFTHVCRRLPTMSAVQFFSASRFFSLSLVSLVCRAECRRIRELSLLRDVLHFLLFKQQKIVSFCRTLSSTTCTLYCVDTLPSARRA